ncbi:B-box zinc finger protein [Lujinxingia litoralis]|uniref:B-box zinc finger protein n=1 Tax=Lujinxingia litoralis TaxID=2211119 RepID=UPI00131410D2|nr:B-box zinc finger protein [Lujinxingia litoralis]
MSSSERICAHHEGAPAIAVCTACRADICGACHGADLRGFAICKPCRQQRLPSLPEWEHGERRFTPSGFVLTAVSAMTSPRTFFPALVTSPRWGAAAGFGILSVLVGTFAQTLWRKAFSPLYPDLIELYTTELNVAPQLAEVALFASLPMGALTLYFLHTAMLYFALRIFGVNQARWGITARITGYALATYLLLLIPPLGSFELGHFLMVVWLFNLEVTAVRMLFGMGFWRSMLAVLLPFMLLLSMTGG